MFSLSFFSSEPSSSELSGSEPSDQKGNSAPEDKASTSIVSQGANIEGILDFASVNLCVKGAVRGDISTDGRVVVAQGAEVQGTITAHTIRLAGYVEGHVRAEKQLVLCPTAEVHATLEADVLEIQPGADFRGEVPEAQNCESDMSDSSPFGLYSTELISVPSPSRNGSRQNGDGQNGHVRNGSGRNGTAPGENEEARAEKAGADEVGAGS